MSFILFFRCRLIFNSALEKLGLLTTNVQKKYAPSQKVELTY